MDESNSEVVLEEPSETARILDSVEIQSDIVEKPRLHFSEYGTKSLDVFESNLDGSKESEGDAVVAVVRCWNKGEEDIQRFIERVNKIKANIPRLEGVVIVLNQEQETGITEQAIEKLAANSSVPLLPISVEKFSWTAGLNSGVAVINETCLGKGISTDKVRVMNMSFDTDLEEAELEKTNQQMGRNDYIFTARKTSQHESPFEDHLDEEGIWEKFKEILRNPNGTELSELSYVMRNTYNVIKLSDIVEMGGFNPMCNGDSRKFSPASPRPENFYKHNANDVKVSIKGMEDAEFFMRYILKALRHNELSTMKKFKQAFAEPVLYEDESWDKLSELKKIKKISNEMQALSLIISGLATKEYVPTKQEGVGKVVGLVKDFYVPKQMQDFYLRKAA